MNRADIITKFYTAFANHDVEEMVSYYHDNITFEDPAFGVLQGERAKNMWRMLMGNQKGKTFIVEFSNVRESADGATAHWEAHYDFSKTGRKVHNKIDAQFKFEGDKIIDHRDTFDVHSWASQAMGLSGKLLGWSGFFSKKLQGQTNAMLNKYEAKK